jgi:hypothetical protein
MDGDDAKEKGEIGVTVRGRLCFQDEVSRVSRAIGGNSPKNTCSAPHSDNCTYVQRR